MVDLETLFQLFSNLNPIAQLTMAFGTLLMVYYTRKTLLSAKWERERNQMIQLSQFILSPFINQLEKQLNFLKQRYYNYITQSFKLYDVTKITVNKILSNIFSDFLLRNESIGKKIDEHNILVEKLEVKLKELTVKIREKEFLAKADELIKKWDAETNQNRSFSESDKLILISYVIDNRKELPYSYSTWYDFWLKYGSELLKFREQEDVKKILSEMEGITIKLEEVSNDLLKRLGDVREGLRKEYKLLVTEIVEPKTEGTPAIF